MKTEYKTEKRSYGRDLSLDRVKAERPLPKDEAKGTAIRDDGRDLRAKRG